MSNLAKKIFQEMVKEVGKFCFAALLLSAIGAGAHGAQVQRELEGVKRKIEKERQGISTVKKKEDSVLKTLGKIEEQLDRKGTELKTINATMESILADLERKEELAKQLSSSLRGRKELLNKRARALYKWHRGGSPFILLNGGFSAARLMQGRRYLGLTLAYDRNLINSLAEESARQETLKAELARRSEELDRQRSAVVELKESIRRDRERKKEILASLRREKEGRQRALKELEAAAQRLQKMMEDLSRKPLAEFKTPSPGTGFEALKGRLDYPVRGEVMASFGKTRHPEFSVDLFRRGIDIEAPLGEEIRAVEKGRVVFADRFSGYGKMMIIDHGQRYYTVYAHLSDLLKKIGETVQKGEAVGLVGDSDSLAGARLYFEIRKDGRPLDPLPWFKKP
ncbi:MAG: peptidoglycan DD-metalloendopeptidase family protein [Deltaproteobacteria bacterium]|nr:peptidoglycan DD-metalloendopeptidase family protein [Deltaproteobacteria bacterium]